MRTLIFLIVSVLSTFSIRVYGQDSVPAEPQSLVKWVTLQEAEALNAKQPKPFIIDFYTDWCGWCKHMMRTTFSDPGIAGYINTNFYPVRFNAETKDTIIYRGEKYWNKSTGNRPPHDLAIKLLQGKLSYPTLLFINNDYKFNLIVPGYQTSLELEPFLVYTVEYVFNTTAVETFRTDYKQLSQPDTLKKDTATIHWMGLEQALELQKSQHKKMLVLISTKWCNSGRIYKEVAFKDSAIVKTVNELFIPVYFDAETTDTLSFKGIAYVNDGTHATLHNLALALCNNRLVLPSLVYVDSNTDLITAIPQYYGAKDLGLMLVYFGKDYFKSMKWEEYIKSLSVKGSDSK